jgi:NAD(P)H-hydrate epimerase
MVETDANDHVFSGANKLQGYTAVGIGCGIGQGIETKNGLLNLLRDVSSPLVLDADALNLIAASPDLLKLVPEGSILTPHLKEFERLFGACQNHFERLEALRAAAMRHNLVIVLKGAHTAVAMSDGRVFFNTTGNPGMATAGSGDVLTGMISGLLAQQYHAEDAALIGVFLHGLAGDLAADEYGEEALIASDIIGKIGEAYELLQYEGTLFDDIEAPE